MALFKKYKYFMSYHSRRDGSVALRLPKFCIQIKTAIKLLKRNDYGDEKTRLNSTAISSDNKAEKYYAAPTNLHTHTGAHKIKAMMPYQKNHKSCFLVTHYLFALQQVLATPASKYVWGK